MFAGLFEDVFRDETISVWESTEGFGSPWVGGLITGETLGGKDEMRVEITRKDRGTDLQIVQPRGMEAIQLQFYLLAFSSSCDR